MVFFCLYYNSKILNICSNLNGYFSILVINKIGKPETLLPKKILMKSKYFTKRHQLEILNFFL